MSPRTLLLAASLAFSFAPVAASAQNWFVTPYVGGNFAGAAKYADFNNLDDELERRISLGATVGWQPGAFGFEIDFGWSPNFFEDTAGDRNFEFGDSNVTTLMANLLVGAPRGAIRPYASGGMGLLRSYARAEAIFGNLTNNDLGLNLGGGVNAMFTPKIGLRGDLRYFRGLEDNEAGTELDLKLSDFDFWRATAGVTFRF